MAALSDDDVGTSAWEQRVVDAIASGPHGHVTSADHMVKLSWSGIGDDASVRHIHHARVESVIDGRDVTTTIDVLHIRAPEPARALAAFSWDIRRGARHTITSSAIVGPTAAMLRFLLTATGQSIAQAQLPAELRWTTDYPIVIWSFGDTWDGIWLNYQQALRQDMDVLMRDGDSAGVD